MYVRKEEHTLGCLEAEESGTNLPNGPRSSWSAATAEPPAPCCPAFDVQFTADEALGTGTFRRLHKRGAGVQPKDDRTGVRPAFVSPIFCATEPCAEEDVEEASGRAGGRKLRPAGRLIAVVGATPSRGARSACPAGALDASDVNLLANLNWSPSFRSPGGSCGRRQ